MKRISRATALILAMSLFAICIPISASAEESTEKTLDLFCYNVAGLPDFSAITGGEGKDVPGNQTVIGKYLNSADFDIVAVQEDFGYHENLISPMTDYSYRTISTGSIPYGDGMNVYTKSMPIYNETRIGWNQLYGILDDGADEFSAKGFMYVVIEIESGVYIDFINLHADAYGDVGSVAARTDNFRQLADFINKLNTGRPLIVTGDFNTSFHADRENFYETLIEGCSLNDAWVDVHNNGSYTDYSYWNESHIPYWGNWDSVERFLYKDGSDVDIEPSSFEYVNVKNGEVSVSDHNAVNCIFTYSVADNHSDNGNVQVIKEEPLSSFIDKFIKLIKAIWLAITNFDTIVAYLQK